jgi:hypothetical protein
MEKTSVLESPDPQKSIDEINLESRPIVITKTSGLVQHPCEASFKERVELFNTLYGQKKTQDNIWDKQSRDKIRKIALAEEELQKLSLETEQLGKNHPEYKENSEEIEILASKLKKIKEKMKKGKKVTKPGKVKFPKAKPVENPGSSKGIKFEVEISNFLEQQKLVELHNHVTELENALGKWEEPQPVGRSISALVFKTNLINKNLLKKIKEESRHLQNDLEDMLSNCNNLGTASDENLALIEKLSYETLPFFDGTKGIPEIVEKFKIFHPVYLKSVSVHKALSCYEANTGALEERIKESLEALKELKLGIAENMKSVQKNLTILSKKLG